MFMLCQLEEQELFDGIKHSTVSAFHLDGLPIWVLMLVLLMEDIGTFC